MAGHPRAQPAAYGRPAPAAGESPEPETTRPEGLLVVRHRRPGSVRLLERPASAVGCMLRNVGLRQRRPVCAPVGKAGLGRRLFASECRALLMRTWARQVGNSAMLFASARAAHGLAWLRLPRALP